jgi:hypothetical protein
MRDLLLSDVPGRAGPGEFILTQEKRPTRDIRDGKDNKDGRESQSCLEVPEVLAVSVAPGF